MDNEQTESVSKETQLLMPRGSIKNTVCEQTRPEDSVEWTSALAYEVEHGVPRSLNELIAREYEAEQASSQTEQEFVPMPEIPVEAIEQINEAMKHAHTASLGSSNNANRRE